MSNKLIILLGCITLTLIACTPQEESGFFGTHLAPCSAEGTPFQDTDFTFWESFYHDTVARVVEAHMNGLRQISSTRLACTAPTVTGLLPPSQPLYELAASLEPWSTSERLAALSELHIGPVLLEFLRTYECANLERGRTLSLAVWERRNGTLSSVSPGGTQQLFDNIVEGGLQSARIQGELRTARTALERTLSITGGLDDLRTIAVELECVKRASLDLRNTLGLAADASACLSKVPGKASLRDLTLP